MSAKTYIGVDIGGTKIAAGLVKGGRVVKRHKEPTETKSVKLFIGQVERIINQLWTPDIGGIGVGMAGLTDHKKGIFLGGPNLSPKLAKIPIVQLLKNSFKVPVVVDNDVHCFTLAEAKIGAGKRFSSVVGINLGTGIGGGLAIEGRLHRGRNNGVGEFGHTSIDMTPVGRCGCGRNGHFESLASGTAMGRLYVMLGGGTADALEVERKVNAGDKRAQRVFALMTDALSTGLANIILTLNPDVIVIGGGLSKVSRLMKPAIKQVAAKIAYQPMRSTPIVLSKIGGDANILGAALLASEKK